MTTSTSIITTEHSDYYYDYDFVRMTPEVQIPSAIGLCLLILLAIVGNVMAIAAYLSDRKLHTVYDFFIFNLAITDLLLSMMSMPFYAVYTLNEFTWPFGTAFYKAWLVVEFTLCFESILLMLILSLDRLLLITLGTSYQTKITMKLAVLEIALSWVMSFMIYSPAIIWWDKWVGYSTVEYMDCDAEFAYDVTFTTTTAFVEFILPFVCLTSLNSLIFVKIRKRLKVRPRAPVSSQMTLNNSTAGPSNVELKYKGTARLRFEHVMQPDQQESHFSVKEISSVNTTLKTKSKQTLNIEASKRINGISSTVKTTLGERTSRARREMKAAIFLASIVVVFLVLWGPYSITRMVISFCEELCINTSVFELFVWILWTKSAINPFLYAFNSIRYRRHFKRYLTCVNCFKFRRQTQQGLP